MIVRFYLCKNQEIQRKVLLRLLENAQEKNLATLLYCAAEELTDLDNYLWREALFLPHAIKNSEEALHCKIHLMAEPEIPTPCQLLINMACNNHVIIPHGLQRYFEIIDESNPAQLAISRQKYKYFRDDLQLNVEISKH